MTGTAPKVAPDHRLLLAAGLSWACAWYGTGGDHGVGWASAAAALVAGSAFVAAALRRAPGRSRSLLGLLAVCLACTGVVATASAVAQSDRYSSPVTQWARDGRTALVTARVVSDPQQIRPKPGQRPGPPRWIVDVSVREATARGERVRPRGSLLVLGPVVLSGVEVGSTVRLSGRLRSTDAGEKPIALLQLTSAPVTLRQPGAVWRAADHARAGLRSAAEPLDPDARGLLPSLVLGDTSRLPADLETAMTTAGLTHLTAVSGANLAIVGGAVLLLASALRLPRAARVLLAGAAIAAFCVAARPEPSVLRAAAMGAVGLLALSIGRRAAAVPAVGVSVVLLLAADPWLSRSYGFALSVLATLGLVVLAPRLAERWSRGMPDKLALALAVPVAAQLVCCPVLVMLDPSVSLVAVPANLVADAAVVPATLSGVAAALLWPVFPWGAGVAARVGGLACDWIALVARIAADLPLATLPWPGGTRGAVLLVVLAGGVAVLATRGPAAGRTAATAVVLSLIVGGGGWLAAGRVPGPWRPVWPGASWDVALCDVGQGLAVVARLAPRHHLLIDTGPEPGPVDGCLKRLGVTRLDSLVLTHAHADHVGGLEGALRGREVEEILVGPLDEPSSGSAAVVRTAASHGVPVRRLTAGGGRDVEGPGAWVAVWPRPGDVPASAGDDERVNDLSLVVDVRSAGGLGVLVLGDVETWAQARLLTALRGAPPRPDVVVVAHHGSADQVGELYRLLAAPVGLIGVGAGNDYGHPDPHTLAMLARARTRVWRSDLCGDVVVARAADGIDVRVQTMC